jgi:N utilization substance protein B
MSNRRDVRERVMQALYAHELAGGDVRHFINTILKPNLAEDAENLKFATSLFLRTIDMTEETDGIISRHTENWDLSRIALIDRILLRMAICELLGFEDIPPKVSINEAIEVAKRYSTPRSGQFINGILDAVLLSLQQEGRLKKSGRGLIGMQPISDRSAS